MKPGRFGELFQIVEGRTKKAQGQCVVRMRRDFAAKLSFRQLEIAPLYGCDGVAHGRAVIRACVVINPLSQHNGGVNPCDLQASRCHSELPRLNYILNNYGKWLVPARSDPENAGA
jgi:hypothetical protein